MSAIDCHCHIYPEPYMDVVADLQRGAAPHNEVARLFRTRPSLAAPVLYGAIDRRLQKMDEAGIATHVLSLAPPYVWAPDVDDRVRLSSAFNLGVSELHREHPTRFRFFANLPMPFVDASIEATREAMRLPGFAGVGIATHTQGIPVDDERWIPLYDVWNQHHLTVFTHPDGLCVPGVLADYGLDLALGAPFDDTIAAARLIHAGVPARFPHIRWIIPHLGGTLPFLLTRLDLMWQRFHETLDMSRAAPSECLDNLYFDTVAAGAVEVQLAAAQLGIERLVLGSDYPNVSADDLGRGIRRLRDAGFSERDIETVTETNPSALLWSGTTA